MVGMDRMTKKSKRAARSGEDLDFGLEVRRRREAQGLTLEGLAARSGLTPNYIGTIENGRRDPSLSTIRALAGGLNATPGELLGTSPQRSPAAEEIARLFDLLSQEFQAVVDKLVRSLLNLKKR